MCRDPYTDMPLLTECGGYAVWDVFTVLCWSVDEMRNRLERSGHVVWKDKEKKTGGEYVIAAGAAGKDSDALKCFGRLVTVRRVGAQKHYQADPESPLFDELCGIARKTVGLAEPLRKALAPVAPKIVAAFVYGSIAKKADTASSDVDLMVVSDDVTYADLFELVEPVSAGLRRTVNPTVYTSKELARRIKEENAFVKRVLSQPKLWIYGSENDLAA